MVKKALKYLADLTAVQGGRAPLPQPDPMPVHFAVVLWALVVKVLLVFVLLGVVAYFTIL
jgi:hypothetical protein